MSRFKKYFLYGVWLFGLVWLLCSCNKGSNTAPPYYPSSSPSGSGTGGNTGGHGPWGAIGQNPLSWHGAMTDFSNKKLYRRLLQAEKRCPFCDGYIGRYHCKFFESSALVEIIFQHKKIPSKVTFRIVPQYRPSAEEAFFTSLVNFSACNETIYNALAPIVYQGTAKAINNSKGFYARLSQNIQPHQGFGQYGGGGLWGGNFGGNITGYSNLTVRSPDHNPEDDDYFNITIHYGGGSGGSKNQIGSVEISNSQHDGSSSGSNNR